MSLTDKEKKAFVDALLPVQQEIYFNACDKGFWRPEKAVDVPEKLCLIHSEISEALEADRKDLMDDKLTDRIGLEVELADACIRILDLSYALGLDIAGAILEKHEYNTTRARMHGGKKY
jgi:hypothetical protein